MDVIIYKSAHPGECRDPDYKALTKTIIKNTSIIWPGELGVLGGFKMLGKRFMIWVPAFAGMIGRTSRILLF